MTEGLLLTFLFLILIIRYILLYKNMIKQKDYFINTLSHDLRVSTIAQIRGLELLEKQDDNELVTEIRKSSLFTLDMINTLLNTFHYENGESILTCETFNFAETIFSSCKTLSCSIEEKELELCYKLGTKTFVQGDKTGLQKVFSILITTAVLNAQQRTPICIRTNNNGREFEVTITYQGRPLSEQEYHKMFSRKNSYSTVGHGIKMQLCKKIIDFHKGKIEVKNSEKNMNLFRFTIPFNKCKKNNKLPFLSVFQLSRL